MARVTRAPPPPCLPRPRVRLRRDDALLAHSSSQRPGAASPRCPPAASSPVPRLAGQRLESPPARDSPLLPVLLLPAWNLRGRLRRLRCFGTVPAGRQGRISLCLPGRPGRGVVCGAILYAGWISLLLARALNVFMPGMQLGWRACLSRWWLHWCGAVAGNSVVVLSASFYCASREGEGRSPARVGTPRRTRCAGLAGWRYYQTLTAAGRSAIYTTPPSPRCASILHLAAALGNPLYRCGVRPPSLAAGRAGAGSA